jgi:uncharacterized protein (TIGR03435 family)
MFAAAFLQASWVAHAQIAASSPAITDACAARTRVSFDVASVKLSSGSPNSSSMRTLRDGLTASGTVLHLIRNAYGLRDFQITGGPEWVNNATFDVSAKIDPPDLDWAKLDAAGRIAWGQREMDRLQSLLAERFHLKCHTVMKELPVYNLVVAKGGVKFQETTAAEDKRGSMSSSGDGHATSMKATGIPMENAAKYLSSELGRTVVDKTGLAGSYDLKLTFAPDARAGETPQTDANAGATLFTALQEQLGLKLESAKGPVEVLVIDSIDKPGEN